MKAEDLHSILESDRSIRFVGIRNKVSNQIVSSYRAGMTPLLTPEEIEMYAMQSVLRMNTRNAGWLLRIDWSNILGLIFTLLRASIYDKKRNNYSHTHIRNGVRRFGE
ncbi:MAG TPA: hypothetical protein VKA91_10445 [Nitrososphaeraceae archaeon]|nr:hypothetical protein [Nitrososphaeraceae archaeon]